MINSKSQKPIWCTLTGYEFLILPNAHVGQACCAKYSEDESWRRAQITGIPSPEQLQVYFVDYGITEVLSNDHVKPLVEEFGTLPTLAVPCCVAYARPVGETWSEGQWPDRSDFMVKDRNENFCNDLFKACFKHDNINVTFKVSSPRVQTFCIDKDSHMDAIFTCKYL